MAPTKLPLSYKAVHLANRPKDGIDKDTFVVKSHSTPSPVSLNAGQVLFKTHYLSLDPAMRGWLNDTRSYIPPVKIGEVMRGQGVGVVIASRSDKFKEGDWVSAMCGWSEFAVLPERDVELCESGPGAKMTDALGVLGESGLGMPIEVLGDIS